MARAILSINFFVKFKKAIATAQTVLRLRLAELAVWALVLKLLSLVWGCRQKAGKQGFAN